MEQPFPSAEQYAAVGQLLERDVHGAVDATVLPLDGLADVEDGETRGQRVGDLRDLHGRDLDHPARLTQPTAG